MITILKLKENQQIARPYDRADDEDEVLELLDYHFANESKLTDISVGGLHAIALGNMDSDVPILKCDDGRVRFYAFTEGA